ncbi:MAG TPA: hypothetical protein VLH61_08665 [Bacteroidales bacterium]|nr:hypothetical protein [Bacteroidales bacterium]
MKYFHSIVVFLILLVVISEAHSQTQSFCRISLTGGSNVVCKGHPLVLIANEEFSFGEPVFRIWTVNGIAQEGENKPYIRFNTNETGIFQVSFQMKDKEGRQSACEIEVNVLPLPEFQIEKSYPLFRNIFRKQSRPRLTINFQETYIVQWFFNDFELPGETQPVLNVKNPGKYRVRVTCLQGCSAFAEIIVAE